MVLGILTGLFSILMVLLVLLAAFTVAKYVLSTADSFIPASRNGTLVFLIAFLAVLITVLDGSPVPTIPDTWMIALASIAAVGAVAVSGDD